MPIRTNTRDGSEIDLVGSAFVVTVGSEAIELKTSATRFWSTPSRYEVTGVRVDEASGTITVMFARDLEPPRVREATFDLDTGVRISQTRDLTARQIEFLEMSGVYGATAGLDENGDLNGNGIVATPPTVGVTGMVATNGLAGDATALFALDGGGFGIASESASDARKIFGQRGDYVLPRDFEAVAVRAGDGGFYLLMSKTERDNSVTFQEQFIVDNGVSLAAAGAPVTLTGRALIDAENAYNLDFNNDGIIGDADLVVARLDSAVNDPAGLGANGSLTSDPDDGIGIYRTQAGRFVIAEEEQQVGQVAGTTGPEPVGPSIFLKTATGADWTAPSGSVIFAVREVGTSGAYQFITRDGNLGASSTSYRVFDVSSTGVVGASVTVDYRQLIQLERTFRQDFDGNGVIGDVAGPRSDASVRIGNGERALYLSEGNALFISADLDRMGEIIWNDPADTNLLLRTLNGITSEDGRVWSPALSASGAEAIAVRETASTYIVLSRVPSVVNPQSWEDYTYIEQSFSKTGIEVRGRFIVDITAQREALYFQDFNGDGIIDLTTVSFTNTAQFVTPPNGARLDGHRLILTAEQAHAMSNGQLTGDGVLAVEGTGALDIGTPEAAAIFRDGAFEIDRKFFLETPHDPVTGSDSLTLTVTGSGTVVDFRCTVPDHALGETSMVKLSGLPQGVTASLLNLEGDLLEGMFLSGGTYVLRLDTTAADTRSFSFTLEQELPDGWGRAAIARDNVLQIADTTLTTDLDLRQVDPDHVVLRFGTPEGTSLEVPAGRTLTIHAEHAAALTLTGDGTVVLLGDLRGHDFTGVQVATIDFSQADVIGTGEIRPEPFELNFPTDAALWPAFELGHLWIIRGGQADIVSKTGDLKIDGTLTTADEFGRTSVGNIRIVDTVEALDLSGVDVAYIDMAGATGAPSKLPAIDAGRFVVLRADQATGLVGDFGGARLHLVSDMTGYSGIDPSIQDYSLVNYLANNEFDFSQINLGGGMFTAIVRSDLTMNTASNLGALHVTVQGAGTTLTLTGAQADGRIINDSVSIWTRDTTRDVAQTDVAGRVVITDAANGIDLSNIGLVVGVDANTGEPNGTTTPNDNLYVTLAFNGGEAGAAFDFTQNTTFGDAPTELVRATDGRSPPALRIDAYEVAAGVIMTLRADQASFREAGGIGKIEIIGLDAGTDLWGFQRGSSPTVDVTVADGSGVLDLRLNASLNDAVDFYTLGAQATQMTAVQATGRVITGATDTALEVHGLQNNTDLSGSAQDLDVTTFQTGTVNIRGNANLATVDTFNIGAGNVLRADTALLGEIVTFVDGTAQIHVGADESLTKAFTFTAETNATLHLATGADIRGATLTGVDTYALENDASVTMTIAQHNDVTSITGAGAETITFSDPGAATGFAAIESYVLADGANTFTLGALAQNVTGGTGANTLVFGAGAYTGTFTGFDAGDTYQVVDGTDLSETTGLGSGILDFQDLPATVTLNAAQNGALTIENASGEQTIVVSQPDTFTADAAIETYRLTGASAITVAAGTNVEVVADDDADQIVIVNGLTTTGTYNLGGGSGDTVSIIATSDISASTFTGVERVTLGENVNATMTIAQNTLISTAAGTNHVTLFDAGVATGAAEVETYVLANGANTFTLGAAGQNVVGGTGNDTVIIGEDMEATGTYALGGGTNTLQLEDGANIAGVNAGGATTATTLFVQSAATMTAEQHIAASVLGDPTVETTITFAGRVFRSTGNGDEALQAAAGIDAYVLGGAAGERNMIDLGANGQSVTGGAANDSVWIGNFTPGAIQLGAGANVLGLHRGNSIVAAGEDIADSEEGGSFEIFVRGGSGSVKMTRSQHEAATHITNDITRFGINHFDPDNMNDISVDIDGKGEINAKANVTGYKLLSSDGNTVILTNETTGTSVFAGPGDVTVEIDGLTLTSQSTLDGGADSRIKIAVSGTTDLTNATLIGVNEITVAEGATLSLTAAQASGLTVTGTGSVIIEGFGATTDLSGFYEGLTIHATVTEFKQDLRSNESVDRLSSLELTPPANQGNDPLLTGAQVSGLEITGPDDFAIWLENIPSDADLSRVSENIFVRVGLTQDVVLSSDAKVSQGRFYLYGQTLTIPAELLAAADGPQTVAARGPDFFHLDFMTWVNSAQRDSAVVVSGVVDDTNLMSFVEESGGILNVTARIDADDTVDLTENGTLDFVTAYEVAADATLTLNAVDVDGRDGSGDGSITIAALNGSGANISDITPSGGVTLALGSTGATLVAGFTFADVSYTVTANGAQTFDITAAAPLPVGTEFVVGEGVTLRLTAAQADTLSVTGDGTVIVEGIAVATADLSSIDAGRLEVHLDYSSRTVDLRDNATLGSVDRYQLTGWGSLSFVLTGEQASGVAIESVSEGPNHEPLIIGMPSDADFSRISARHFYVILDEDVVLADTAKLGDISGLFLGGKELSIAADLLPKANETEHPLKDVIRLNNGNNSFWYREFEPEDDSTGAIVVRGVQEDTHLWLFNHFNFGRPPVTARIDEGTTVDLTGNSTTNELVTTYEVQSGATLTLTESQVTNAASISVGGLPMVTVIGDGKLVVDGLALGTDLSQVAESLTLDVLVTSDVDVTQNTTLGNVDEFIVSSGATLTLTAAQADGVSVTGAGNVIITALGDSDADISGIMVSGDVSLDAGNPNPVLEAGFTFGAREYKVIGAGTLDISAVTTVAATGFDVADGSELLASAAQIEGLKLGAGALKGEGSVVLTGVNATTSIGAEIFGGSLTVTAVLGEDFAFTNIPEWATRLKLDGNIVTLGYEELDEITLEPGPGRLVLTGQVPEILDLSGIPAGTIVELSGLCSDCTIQIKNRADGVFVNPGENLVGLLMVNIGGAEPETLAIKGSIQDAINEANSGDAITVGAGEFFAPRLGFIDVNKPVSLWGAQVGNKSDGSDVRSGGESVIKVSADFDSGWEFVWGSNRPADNVIAGTAASALMVRVTADNVTIDGFTFTNFHRDAINVRSIKQEGSPDLSNISIMNNVIVMDGTRGESFTDPTESRFNQYNAIVFGEGVGDPVRSGFEPTFSNMVVSGNFVDITHYSNFFSGARGLILTNHFTDGAGLIFDNFTITDNIFSTYFDVFVSGQVAKTFFENGQIFGNSFNGTRGITGPNFKDVEITGNSFDTALYGIEISADGTLIDGNTFTTGRLYGVHLKDNTGLGGRPTSENIVSNNDFTYNIVETADGRFVGGIAFFDGAAFATDGSFGNTFNDSGVSASTVTYETFRFVPGTSEADVLTSTGLDEVFVGGAGADTFVFSGVDIGNDVIADFVSGRDKISFEGLAVSSLDDLDLAVQEGNKIITALDGQFEGMITLLGVTSLSLEEDFVFDTQA